MSNDPNARKRLTKVIKVIASLHIHDLDDWKERRKDIKRQDFVWHYLLQNFATSGNVRGWNGLIDSPDNYQTVTFDALSQIPPTKRLKVLESTLRKAKVRLPAEKAEWLAENFELMQDMGGPAKVKKILLSRPGRDQKIEFLKSFKGVGNKIARNMMMDVYHPEFEDTIAIDARITSISKLLGLAFTNYLEHEQFYLDIAREAQISGWELDRLLFNFTDEVVAGLRWMAITDSKRAG